MKRLLRAAVGDPLRLVPLLAARLSITPTIAARLVAEGRIEVAGKRCKTDRAIVTGDRITAFLPDEDDTPTPLTIAYRDAEVLVLDKPAGMRTQEVRGDAATDLVGRVQRELDPQATLLHRLDRDTSGLLVVAKTDDALGTLGRAMQKRYIKREYRGIVAGVPREVDGVINGAIGRDPHNRLKYAIRADGKPAVTHYEMRQRFADAAELTLRLETGRTHQIRVHFAALGYPIFNDPIYGKLDPRTTLPGQALHAWRLAFKHPATKEMLEFEAPLPPAYAATLDALAR